MVFFQKLLSIVKEKTLIKEKQLINLIDNKKKRSKTISQLNQTKLTKRHLYQINVKKRK